MSLSQGDWPRPIRLLVAKFLTRWPLCCKCGNPASNVYSAGGNTWYGCEAHPQGNSIEIERFNELRELALNNGCLEEKPEEGYHGVIYRWPQDPLPSRRAFEP